MTTTTIDSPHSNIRKPSIALNLSLLSPGLGHLYCGVIAKGLLILTSCLFGLIVFVLGFIAPAPWAIPVVTTGGIFVLGLTAFAAIDARRLARATRADYRLKDYNRPLVYLLVLLLSGISAPFVALVVRGWIVQAFRVGGNSSFPTYHLDDRVLANKQAYVSSDPERGDVIVFRSPVDRQKTWIKRVVAVAGDTIEIRNGTVMVNDLPLQSRKLDETSGGEPGEMFEEKSGDVSYRIFRAAESESEQDTFEPTTVPPNHVFVLGDNRDRSRDSRHFGAISIFSITGKVTTRYWPLSR